MSTYIIHPTQEQEKLIKLFLEALNVNFISDEPLVDQESEIPEHVMKGIEKSREDFKEGRFIDLDEFKKRFITQAK